MTFTKLPFLHKNARSQQITSKEIREVYQDEITRGLPRHICKNDYLRKVMP